MSTARDLDTSNGSVHAPLQSLCAGPHLAIKDDGHFDSGVSNYSVRIITTDKSSFARILALANVVEAHPANNWAEVHGAWEASAQGCMSICFSKKQSSLRLYFETRRIVHPDLYRLVPARQPSGQRLISDAAKLSTGVTLNGNLGEYIMDSGLIIGLLALFTIGIVLVISIFHFGFFLRDPRNRRAAKNALVDDGPSAATAGRSGSPAGPYRGLVERTEEDRTPVRDVQL